MQTPLRAGYDFASLSLRDLLEARDLYHFHLMNKANVVGTAIGRYLIRHAEEWPSRHGKPARVRGKRTLENAEVRDYSWPCVLVFVSEWLEESAFHAGSKRTPPTSMVPQTLYMPDGRAVPVCVVAVEPDEADPAAQPQRRLWPQHTFGGGMPITVDVQHETHSATAGCLVSDGNQLYALTARHACGEPGGQIYGTLRSGRVRIGRSAPKQLTRLPFSAVYPAFAARQTYLNLDVGLVAVDSAGDWTCNVYGMPPIKAIFDLYEQNMSLQLLEREVIAYGAASGHLKGTIKALFYRYRSVGGFEYVSDFLIAPQKRTPNSRHGDSGAIWHIDVTDQQDEANRKHPAPKPLKDRDLRPIAVQWGGLTFRHTDEGVATRSNLALATSLSNVCKLLDVDLVTDHNVGASGYWGRVGHFSIARMAIDLVTDTKLKALLEANANSISFDLDTIQTRNFDKQVATSLKNDEFAHLADIPDDVWKHWPEGHNNGRKGGRDDRGGRHGSDGPEHANHYADVDIVYTGNKLFRSLCREQPNTYLTLSAWQAFYDAVNQRIIAAGGKPKTETNEGILPFRVWQFFEALTGFAAKGDVTSFVAAAGILAHYVGDACQPLHGSQFGQSDDSRPTTTGAVNRDTGEPLRYGDGAHSAYESKMLDLKASELFPMIAEALPKRHGLALVADGRAAALDTIVLMDDVAAILPPMDILDAFEKAGGGTRNAQFEQIWNTKKIGERTAKVMALGVRHLAMIWDAAWKAGNGARIAQSKLKPIDQGALRRCYENVNFVPSRTIKTLGKLLPQAQGVAAAAGATPAKKTGRRSAAAPRKAAARQRTAKSASAVKKAKKTKAATRRR